MVRTETLRTYDFWKFFRWSVPKHYKLTTSGNFLDGPYRNIAYLQLLENFQMVRSETLQCCKIEFQGTRKLFVGLSGRSKMNVTRCSQEQGHFIQN
jgi:hypothetical protein